MRDGESRIGRSAHAPVRLPAAGCRRLGMPLHASAAAAGLLDDLPCGAEILFHQKRRQRQHLADVVVAVAEIIRRQRHERLALFVMRNEAHGFRHSLLRIEVGRGAVNAEEVVHRVVVFHLVQPAQRDVPRVADAAGFGPLEHLHDPVRELQPLGAGRLPLVLGRHLGLIQRIVDFLPRLARLKHLSFGRERGQDPSRPSASCRRDNRRSTSEAAVGRPVRRRAPQRRRTRTRRCQAQARGNVATLGRAGSRIRDMASMLDQRLQNSTLSVETVEGRIDPCGGIAAEIDGSPP